MKILYLCSDQGVPVLGHKGASVHVRELIGALIQGGHSVVLAAPVLNKSQWETPASVSARLLHLPASSHVTSVAAAMKEFNGRIGLDSSLPGELRRILYDQEVVVELQRRFEADPPDFIYERAALFGTAGVTVARRWKIPLFLELNAPLAGEQTTYRSACLAAAAAQAERWTLSQADAVLAVSTAVRDHVVALGTEPSRVHVLPNGVNPLLFHPGPRDLAWRARHHLGEAPVLGFVGGLRPWHGVDVLPALLQRLARRRPKLRLVIVGDGPLRGELEAGLVERGVRERVIFCGAMPHEEVAGVIRQFDVALAPYPRLNHEFYFSPLKLFEYMACGVAVVASKVGQVAELIRHGRTGLLYPAGGLDGLTRACERLLDDTRLRRTLARNASKLVHAHYTWEKNASRVIELARGLIGARAKRVVKRRVR